MLERFFNWLLDWFLVRVAKVRTDELRESERKAVDDAQKRMDAVAPASRKSVSNRLRDGSA